MGKSKYDWCNEFKLEDILDMDMYDTQEERVKAKIKQRRYQILVHSYIYYELNDNIVSDHKWIQWAKELVWLTEQFPDLAKEVDYSEEFEDFTGSTGYGFKYDDHIKWLARRQLRMHQEVQ